MTLLNKKRLLNRHNAASMCTVLSYYELKIFKYFSFATFDNFAIL